jgi:hypothetical protein
MHKQLHQRTLKLLTQASPIVQKQSHTLETVETEASNLIKTAKMQLIRGSQEMNATLFMANQPLEHY